MPSSVGLTRSRSPTDAPPTVTSTSAPARAAHFLFEVGALVGRDAEQPRLAPGLGDKRRQAIRIGGYDLVGPRHGTRLHELIAGREDGDQRLPVHRDLRVAAGGGESDRRGVEAVPGAEHHLAGTEVAAGLADMGAGLCGLAHDDPVAAALGVLLDHHRVGAVGQGRAGENARRLARRKPAVETAPGLRLADDGMSVAGTAATSAARTA